MQRAAVWTSLKLKKGTHVAKKMALLETEGRGQVNGRSIEGRKCLKDLQCFLDCAGAGQGVAEVQGNSSPRALRASDAGSKRQICQDEVSSIG